MHAFLANTVWAPIFVYSYDTLWVLCSVAIGFIAEFCVFYLYTRSLLSRGVAFRRLMVANLVSCVTGFFLMAFMPLGIHKISLAETSLAYFGAYLITFAIEFYVLRSLLPSNRPLLLRALAMANLFSYAILFTGYVLWFGS